jgi:hypothetical protein
MHADRVSEDVLANAAGFDGVDERARDHRVFSASASKGKTRAPGLPVTRVSTLSRSSS